MSLHEDAQTIAEAFADSEDQELYDATDRIRQAFAADAPCEQALALARLMTNREPSNVSIAVAPFDLPAGYWLVRFERSGFTCGIAPDGSVSS